MAADGNAATTPRLVSALKNPMSTQVFARQLISAAVKKTDLDDPLALTELPATAFSELLRSLDPIDVISEEVDPTTGIRVGPGMAHRTPLGDLIDIYGVRKSYLLLFRRLLAAVQLRIDAGKHLLLSDYKVLPSRCRCIVGPRVGQDGVGYDGEAQPGHAAQHRGLY